MEVGLISNDGVGKLEMLAGLECGVGCGERLRDWAGEREPGEKLRDGSRGVQLDVKSPVLNVACGSKPVLRFSPEFQKSKSFPRLVEDRRPDDKPWIGSGNNPPPM